MGLDPQAVLDFSASVSPIGPPEGVWEAMRGVDLGVYPDPQCLLLREALAAHLSPGWLDIGRILVGNGSTEIIHLIARAYLSPPRSGTANAAFLLTPTYGEYAGACGLAGAGVSSFDSGYRDSGDWDSRARPGFRWDLDLAAQRIREERPSLVFVCNPNNPTGVFLEKREVALLLQSASEAGSLLVLDEAYISFVDGVWDSLALLESANVLLLRSMTKDYGLTALRLGYSLAQEEVTERLAAFQPDWSVNGLSQAAGLVALADTGYLERARLAVAEAKAYLTQQLNDLGFYVSPSAANFLLVQVGDAAAWRAKLMRLGIFVRDCTSFGLPDYLRVGIRSLPDCRRLAQAMTDLA
jgi:histidinol-phosphate aminotransferase